MDKLNCSRLARVLGVLAAMALLGAPGLVAQTGSVTGRVIDAQSGQSIAAAQVFIARVNEAMNRSTVSLNLSSPS